MKTNSIIMILIITTIMQACQGQTKILDLETITFPIKKTELSYLNPNASWLGIGSEDTIYTRYSSNTVDSNRVKLFFADIPIIKVVNEKTYMPSEFSLCAEQNSDDYAGYSLRIDDTKNLSDLITYFLKNKDRFQLVFDNGKEDNVRARVFTSKKNNTTYLVLSQVNPYNNNKKTGTIEAINPSKQTLLFFQSGASFMYYGDFLEYKKRWNKPDSFSYLDFMNETDNDSYRKNNNLK